MSVRREDGANAKGARQISRLNALTLVGDCVVAAALTLGFAVGLWLGFLVPPLPADAVGIVVRAIRLSARKRMGFIFML
jgi:hypothetical protein